MRRSPWSWAWWFPVLLLAGCAGYQLGPTNGVEARSQSVQVNFFQNRTLEPRVSEDVAHALRKRFQQEGTYRLATHGDGDIIVNGVLLAYDRTPVSYQPKDVTTVQDYDLTLRAHVVAVERQSGRKLLDQDMVGHATMRIGPDQTTVERQLLPVLAADLAHNITARLVDGSW